MDPYVFVYNGAHLRKRRFHLEEFLIFAYNRHPLHHHRICQYWRETTSSVHDAIFFQVIYLLLHDLVVVLSLGYATTHLGVAFARLGGIYTPLPIPSILLVLFMIGSGKITLSLGPYGFCPLGTCLARVFLVWT